MKEKNLTRLRWRQLTRLEVMEVLVHEWPQHWKLTFEIIPLTCSNYCDRALLSSLQDEVT